MLDSGKWDEVQVRFSSQAFSVTSLGPHPSFRSQALGALRLFIRLAKELVVTVDSTMLYPPAISTYSFSIDVVSGASPGGSAVKNLPAMQETWVQSLDWEDPWRRERLPTPVFWSGEFHGLYNPWGPKESDMTE